MGGRRDDMVDVEKDSARCDKKVGGNDPMQYRRGFVDSVAHEPAVEVDVWQQYQQYDQYECYRINVHVFEAALLFCS